MLSSKSSPSKTPMAKETNSSQLYHKAKLEEIEGLVEKQRAEFLALIKNEENEISRLKKKIKESEEC